MDRPLEGKHTNYFEIGHNAFEFLLDFGQYYPGGGEPQAHTRIVTNPRYAKELLRLLGESITAYEKKFGEISCQDDETLPPSSVTNR